jgi:hypothetical protein
MHYGLNFGENIAKGMCFESIEVQKSENVGFPVTPLWSFILKEARFLAAERNTMLVDYTLIRENYY